MNATNLQYLFEQHGFQGDEWKRCAQVSIQESSLHYYFDQWVEKLDLSNSKDLFAAIDQRGLQEDFFHGLGARKNSFFQAIEAFQDFIKYGLSYVEQHDSAQIFVPFGTGGKELAALTALLYEQWPFSRWKVIAEENNTILSDNMKLLSFDITEIKNSAGLFFQCGGKNDWANNFIFEHDRATLSDRLKNHIEWNTDMQKSSLDIIFCPNVMSKLNTAYRNQILKRFDHLLKKDGLLVLGQFDSLRFSAVENDYEAVTERETLFKKLF